MTEVAQDFEATRRNIETMREMVRVCSRKAMDAVNQVSEMPWTGPTRHTFEQLAAGWYSSMIAAMDSFAAFIDTTERVVNDQQRAEEERASPPPLPGV
ncbi:hypothetical protein [Streptomyces sp. NPDC056632]|uniref:hypothetical protein n=1 Tax=Streptomyces sp. NPDC056632 TaxID=3345884 RepID=UPI0036CD0FBA